MPMKSIVCGLTEGNNILLDLQTNIVLLEQKKILNSVPTRSYHSLGPCLS